MRSLSSIIFVLAFSFSPIHASCPEQDIVKKWSESSSWPGNQVPDDRAEVTLDFPVLLDTETSRLKSVTIVSGGRLVFSPTVDLAKITSDHILVNEGGSFEIGSPDCPFTGKAEVLLTGERNDDTDVGNFGQKFLGVSAGGSIKIHGKPKLSWTKLAKTLSPNTRSFSTVNNQPSHVGLAIYELDRKDGTLLNSWDGVRSDKVIANISSSIAEDSVVIMTNHKHGLQWMFKRPEQRLPKLFDGLQKIASQAPLDELRNNWEHPYDIWTAIVDRVDNTAHVSIDKHDEDKTEAKANLEVRINGVVYNARHEQNIRGRWRNEVVFEAEDASTYNKYTIEVEDDADTWEAGDKIVIASSDLDWQQAETLEVVSANGKTVELKGEILYQHYADVYNGVDMRAEVGLLSRNVLIHGEMSDKCTEEDGEGDLNDCDELSIDTFGGHTKALKGFKAYNIEGAELTNMGQATRLGSYPIHYHMCHDTVNTDGVHPLVKSNSIHHCFSRCVTIHGSHGVHVKDNVAYDTMGHCYFLEDGGEKNTVFDHNLGLGTKKGLLTPSDKQPATFWITSPLTTMTNNAAAGSDARSGFGIWYLFPDEPVGPSTGLGFFARKEAKHTPITLFQDNSAHSNGKIGLALFRRLDENHGIIGCSTYNPTVDPSKPRHADLLPAMFDGFTGYKNRESNALFRSTTIEISRLRVADSQIGVKFIRNMLDGYQLLKDAVIVGDSPNASPFTKKDHDKVGILVDSEGPLHIKNVEFVDFATKGGERRACAIKFARDFKFLMGVSSSVEGLTFTNSDEAQRICKTDQPGPGDTSMHFKDIDGSLTGAAGSTVIYNDESVIGTNCEYNQDWDMATCPSTVQFAAFYTWPRLEPGVTFVTKEGSEDNNSNRKKRVAYTFNVEDNYVMHWKNTIPKVAIIRVTGLKTGGSTRIGVCLPLSAVATSPAKFVSFDSEWKKNDEVVEATSLQDLDDETTDSNVYLEASSGILYVKFNEVNPPVEGNYGDCSGGSRLKYCPTVNIKLVRIAGVDLTDGDCTSRMTN